MPKPKIRKTTTSLNKSTTMRKSVAHKNIHKQFTLATKLQPKLPIIMTKVNANKPMKKQMFVQSAIRECLSESSFNSLDNRLETRSVEEQVKEMANENKKVLPVLSKS